MSWLWFQTLLRIQLLRYFPVGPLREMGDLTHFSTQILGATIIYSTPSPSFSAMGDQTMSPDKFSEDRHPSQLFLEFALGVGYVVSFRN